jgi:hypothetical protein
MKWTTTPPQAPGWYWMRYTKKFIEEWYLPTQQERITEVVYAKDFFSEEGMKTQDNPLSLWAIDRANCDCEDCEGDSALDVTKDGREWAGPIEKPEEQE